MSSVRITGLRSRRVGAVHGGASRCGCGGVDSRCTGSAGVGLGGQVCDGSAIHAEVGHAERRGREEADDARRDETTTCAVLVDRGGRQLPIEPAFSAARVTLAPGQSLRLARAGEGRFSFEVK